jgi:hypothetical protein
MKIRSLIIFVIILFSLLLAFYINKFLQRKIKLRLSFLRLMIYLLSAFGLVFIYAFLLVWTVAHLFPLQ